MNGVLASARMPALVLLVLSLLAIGSGGQELPGRVAGTGQLSFNSGVNPFGMSSDIFVGNDA
ncbi:MAG TPA: hypothetical protein VFI02_08815, partial [Armatimonadota bacterium]|nr:hypothetical protein [Armatimonadota bacterium]